jgi:hypothetical protein
LSPLFPLSVAWPHWQQPLRSVPAQLRVSFSRDSAAPPSNARSFIRRRKYPVNGQNTIRAGRPRQAPAVISHTRPPPILGSFHQARSDRVEVKVFHLLDSRRSRTTRAKRSNWGSASLPRCGSNRQVTKENWSDNTKRRKRDMTPHYTPDCTRTSRRVSEEPDSALPATAPWRGAPSLWRMTFCLPHFLLDRRRDLG